METVRKTVTALRQQMISPALLAPLCALCAVLALVQSARVENLRTASAASASANESALEKVHAMGYESGYQSAVVDAYTDSSRYLIEEEAPGAPVMWRKVEIEEPNLSVLNDRLAARDQEPLSAQVR